MSSIHAFEPRRLPASRLRRGPAETATIIIFPGVRYERERDPDSERNAAGPAALPSDDDGA